MATTQHKIDGTNVNYVSSAPWEQPVTDQSLNRIAVHQRWRRHTWQAPVMTAAEFATLVAKRETAVSITTTDPGDKNADFVTYYGAIVKDMSYQRHEGLLVHGVGVLFLVRV